MDDSPGQEPGGEIRMENDVGSLLKSAMARFGKVTQSFTLLYRRVPLCAGEVLRASADYKSAVQQSGTLRYATLRYAGCGSCHVLLHFHSCGLAHSRALTGLCST